MHRADFLEENYDVFPILHGLYAACATSTILPFFSILSHGRRRISRTLIERLLVSTIKCDHVKLLRLPWHSQVRSNKAKYLNVEPFSKIFYIDYTLCFVETIDGSWHHKKLLFPQRLSRNASLSSRLGGGME